MMTGTKEIRTDRLLLRKYDEGDSRTLHEKFGTDPKMYEYSGWNPYASYDMARETVQRFIDSYDQTDFYGWAIEKEGRLIGTVGAYDHDPNEDRIEIGISIERASWGKGYATEALIGVIRYLSGEEGIRVITAWCASDNIGSMKTMEKAGMKHIATEKNALEVNGITYDKLIYEYELHS